MSDVVRDTIAASIAELTRFQAAPSEPYGYGCDVSCAYDVDRNVRELGGGDRLVLAQALVRRLDTPRGSLPDDLDYGISLRSMLNVGLTAAQQRAIAGRIYNELTKDDRVEALSVSIDTGIGGGSVGVSLVITAAEDPYSFTMTLAVTSGSILLEAIA